MVKIVLVDDFEPGLAMTEFLLKNSGYDVITAANGIEAMEKVRQHSPDVIISDILMPEMDGFTLCRRLKMDDRYKHIPIVFFSAAFMDAEDSEFGLSLGAEAFIIKSRVTDDFITEIQQIIQKCMPGRSIEMSPENLTESYINGFPEAFSRKLQMKMLELEEINRCLNESDQRFRVIFEQANEAIFVHDSEGNFQIVNPKACQSLGYTEDELLNLNVSDVDFDYSRRLRDEKLWHELPDCFESRYRRKDGLMFPVEVRLSLIKYLNTRHILAMVSDISQKLWHEKILALRLSLSEFSAAHSADDLLKRFLDEAETLTGSDIGFFHFLEPDQVTLSLQMWSTNTLKRMCSVNGIGKRYPISKAGVWVDCIKERRPVIHNDYEALPHRKGVPEGHARVIRELVVPVIREGKIVAVLGVGNKKQNYSDADAMLVCEMAEMAWDIVRRKRAEEDLIKSEANLKNAQRIAHIGSWEFLPRTGALSWSDEIYNIFEVDPNPIDILYDVFLATVHPDDRETVDAMYRSSDKTKTSYTFEYRLQMQDGRIKFVQEHGQKIYCQSGEPVRSLGTLQDITRIKEMELQQRQYEIRIQQAQRMEALGTLAGGIAHDFNNILSPILGYAEIVKEELPSNHVLQESVDGILHAGLRARDLVKQILTVSRQHDHEMKPIRLQPVVKEALKLLRASLPTTIEIRRNIAADCGVVNADPTQIHQVVMNLATNAFHAMEETGGILTVNLKQIRVADQPIFSDLKSGEYVVLTVADTGMGIAKENLEKIFFPYFSTKEKGKGTGLGLAVVQGIVKSYNGDIHVYSEISKGTEVLVYLPVMRLGAPQSNEADKPISGGDERILLVDDEAAIAGMEHKILERLGYSVTACIGSINALDTFKATPSVFDLVVTDMTMPEMTGVQLSREIRSVRPDIPIIICTGFSQLTDDEICKKFGIQAIVNKPLMRHEIAKTIRDVLDGD